MIGKLETMQSDLSYLGEKFPKLSEAFNRTPRINSADTKDDYGLYYDLLPDVTKAKICNAYRADFELFDYNCDIL